MTFAENLHSLDEKYSKHGGNYKKRIHDQKSGLDLRFNSYVVRILEQLVQDCRGLMDKAVDDILTFSLGFWNQGSDESHKLGSKNDQRKSRWAKNVTK